MIDGREKERQKKVAQIITIKVLANVEKTSEMHVEWEREEGKKCPHGCTEFMFF